MSPPAVFAVFCLILPTILVLGPKLVVVWLLIATAVIAVMLWRRDGRLPWPARSVTLCLAALFAWALVSCLWTLDPLEAVYLLFRIGIFVASGLVLAAAAHCLTSDERPGVHKAIVAGFAIAVAVVVFERALGQPIYQALSGTNGNHTPLSAMNRGATALAILVWPVTGLLFRGRAGPWALLLPPALFVVLLFLESGAALLGVATGAVAGLLGLWYRPLARRVLMLTLTLIVLFAPLAAQSINGGPLESRLLDDASQHRVEIWRYSAEQIAEKPVLGWGFDAADDLADAGVGPAGLDLDHLMPGHPHNVILQIWLELGGIGAALTLLLLLVLLGRISHLPLAENVVALAVFASSFAIGLVSYGLWQSHWIGIFLSAAVVVFLIRRPAGDPVEGPDTARG